MQPRGCASIENPVKMPIIGLFPFASSRAAHRAIGNPQSKNVAQAIRQLIIMFPESSEESAPNEPRI
jgi:hypothetical protein